MSNINILLKTNVIKEKGRKLRWRHKIRREKRKEERNQKGELNEGVKFGGNEE